MIDLLLARTKTTRHWPIWARLAGAVGVALLFVLLRLTLPWIPAYPVLLSLLAVVVSTLVFGRLPGALSLLLVDVFAVLVYLPHDGFAVQKSADALGMLLFNAICVGAIAMTSTLHALADRLAEANGRLCLADQRFAASERDKALLVKEAGHRIRNNLSTLIGVIRVQERSIEDPRLRAILRSATDRIQVFARVHDRLETSESTAAVDLPDFLQALCEDLRSALSNLKPISLSLDVERELLPQKQAVALGLCVNELVTNAMKHAFPAGRSGAIAIAFRRRGDRFDLTVDDDGVGIGPSSEGAEERGSIGQLLVRAMVAQLGGSFDLERREPQGTQARIRFPASNLQGPR